MHSRSPRAAAVCLPVDRGHGSTTCRCGPGRASRTPQEPETRGGREEERGHQDESEPAQLTPIVISSSSLSEPVVPAPEGPSPSPSPSPNSRPRLPLVPFVGIAKRTQSAERLGPPKGSKRPKLAPVSDEGPERVRGVSSSGRKVTSLVLD